MIIHKIEMFNFRQFIGHQTVSFSTDKEKNVTVLIGINTSGKTTIVRAFEWCLYGKNEFDDPILLNSEVRDQMNVGDIQEPWVAVTFEHDDVVYTIKRLQRCVCTDRYSEDGNVVVKIGKKPTEFPTLEYLQKDGQTKTPIHESNISESMNRVLPRDLSDYFFFGGERISEIANRADLSKAVRGLMRLDVLENACTHLKSVLKEFEKEIDTTGDANAQKAKDALETYKIKKEEREKDQANAEANMAYWQNKEKEYNAELSKSDIEQVKKAKKERDAIAATQKKTEQNIEDLKSRIVTAFNTRAFAYFGLPSINASLEFLEDAKDNTASVHEAIPAMEQDAVDFLLKRGFCVCGTKLVPGEKPYLRLMAERQVLPPEHVGDAVRQFKDKSEGYLAGSENYKDNIENLYKDYRNNKRQLGILQDEYEEKSKLIVDDSDAKEIELKRNDAHHQYMDALSDYKEATSLLAECNTNIKNCEDAISKFAGSSKKNKRVARLMSYTQAVYDWTSKTYKEKEDVVRSELEERVNDNFAAMYHGTRAIKIDDHYRVEYKDIKNDESTGLKAVRSFAFIASLVSMAKDRILDDSNLKLGQVYPLVMDAPFSGVDEIHIDNICKILPNTANQVIIAVMQKDWDYASKNLNAYVGKSYSIEKDKDADGRELDTATHIV